ncbi:Hsp90 co-chaperone Cdc37 [Elsinoe australis]|uniref:Hsp90 chaperone protein kinase-targeting subunit n=1 Tax=Elsinoe australis TaxID=40998 RepID=A0A4U7BBK0_9PEZI|nr:Hsp90 co-chaperone Cdc37 [Elsinoe australis]
MPVDYSKWDALELSDDSDIEVHPNVDKRSFIRAKQNQIHQTRLERKHRIETLKYERIINDGLITRIDALINALKSHEEDAKARNADVEQIVFQSLLESTGSAEEDVPPPPPAGVHVNAEDQPRYSKMMAALIDQVKKAVDEQKPTDRYGGFIAEASSHKSKVQGLQKELLAKLAELENEDKGKITSEDIKYGFDSSAVSKSKPIEKESSVPELLNPLRPAPKPVGEAQTAGSEADVEDEAKGNVLDGSDEEMSASPLAKRFGKIKFGDYRQSLDFIGSNPSIVNEKNTDGLLVEAFNAQSEGQDEYARQCVHQALLLQYCRQLGKDGVGLFFKRVTTQGHQAQKLFLDDVNSTYARIRSRTKELADQRKKDIAEGNGDVEQIQLHAVDPNTEIHITVPSATPESEEEKYARTIFDSFPPGLQRALETGQLDKINEVLGKMSVDEAEEVVEKLGNGGMLSVEQGVIDATTEEGRKQMEEIERSGQMPGQAAEEVGDPGMD